MSRPAQQQVEPESGTTRRSGTRKLLYSSVLILALLAAAEGVCRLLPASRPPVVEDYIEPWENWQDDHDGQIRSIAEDFWVLQGPLMNEDGFRDREHAIEPAPGIRRVACLGDSVTFGYYLPPWEAYPVQLERALKDAGVSIEVFNAAVPGWSIRQQRIAYENLLRKYGIDDVILGVCLNDIPEMQNNLATARTAAVLSFLARNSALVRVLFNAHAREIADVMELFTQADSPRVRYAWSIYLDELLALYDAVRRDRARLIVTVFPFRLQVEEGAPEPLPQRHLADFCRDQNIPFLDLHDAVADAGPSAFRDYDHLTPLGCRVVAEAIAASGLLDPVPAPDAERLP